MKKLILLSILLIVGCEEALEPQDCAGIDGGTAVLDDCGICTGITNYVAGSCYDCAGVANGTSWESDCGCVSYTNSGDDCDDICGLPFGINSSCTGCFDSQSYNYCSDCIYECENCCIMGIGNFDLNGDGSVDILDIVHVVESIFNPTDEFDTDIAQDGIINVLDASIIYSSILDRVDNATAIRFFNEENGIHFESNGWVGGIEILLSHDADFGIELTDNSVLADNKTDDNQTKLIILAPESDELFTSLGIFEIISIIAVHESYIDIIQVYNQP